MTTTTADTVTRTLEAPGATITYDVRRNEAGTKPPLFILGSPMGASGFAALASRLGDRTVITYDPRGMERSVKADPSTESTPQQHAEDIHAVIQATGLGPVDLFASSGGAVNALALVAAHPDDVRTLVAHEPPLAAILPDAENAKAAVRGIQRSYREGGFGRGMAHFIAVVGYQGEFPDGFGDQPGPDPAMFGMPAVDDGSRNDVLLAQNIITCTHYQPDFEALTAASTRILPAAGVDKGTMANRGAHAVAERLGVPVTDFPGGHGGFLPVEWGQGGDPEAFAARLHEVLDTAG